jgi:histidinol phosphatase-like enzyme (inositol monophosphatase family)
MQSRPDPRECEEIIQFALHTMRLAGRLILSHFDTPIAVEQKQDQSPVTVADRGAEELIRGRIERAFPDHNIVGEEFGGSIREDRLNWIIDPIDGTQSFIHGVPIFGSLLALLHGREPIVGVISFPALQTMAWGATGLGAFQDGRRIFARSTSQLQDATLLCTSVGLMTDFDQANRWERLRKACRVDRCWGDCYGHFLVASGRADIMCDVDVKEYDVLPLIPVLKEAGAEMRMLDGGPFEPCGNLFSACNGTLADSAVEAMRG